MATVFFLIHRRTLQAQRDRSVVQIQETENNERNLTLLFVYSSIFLFLKSIVPLLYQ